MVAGAYRVVALLFVVTVGLAFVPSADAECHLTAPGCKDCNMYANPAPSGCTIGRVKDVVAKGGPAPGGEMSMGDGGINGRIVFELTWDTATMTAPAGHAPVALTIEVSPTPQVSFAGANSTARTFDNTTVGPQRDTFAFEVDENAPQSSFTATTTSGTTTSTMASSSATSSSVSSSSSSTTNTSTSGSSSGSGTNSASFSVTIAVMAGSGQRHARIPFTIIADAGTPGEERLEGVFTYSWEERKDPVSWPDFLERHWPIMLVIAAMVLVLLLVVRGVLNRTEGAVVPRAG